MKQPEDNSSSGTNHLTQEQLRLIDRALGSIPGFGEVRLVVEKGKLRFLVVQKSYDAINIAPDVDERFEF